MENAFLTIKNKKKYFRPKTISHFSNLEWIFSGEKEKKFRIQALRKAKYSVKIAIYYFEFDEWTFEFLHEIKQALQRGIKIWLAFDSFGQMLAEKSATKEQINKFEKTLKFLKKRGLKLRRWKTRSRLEFMLGCGNHIKVQISDGEYALFGSSNLSSRSLYLWEELSAILQGNVVQVLEAWFDYSFKHKSPTGGGTSKEELSLVISEENECEFIWFNPERSRNRFWPFRRGPKFKNLLTEELIQGIRQAKSHIYISSFFFKPPPHFFDEILAAADRGVKIKVFHSSSEALHESDVPWLPSVKYIEEGLKKNMEIFEHQKGIHAKLFSIDSQVLYFGCYNLETSAHERVSEAMMKIIHPKLIQQCEEWLLGFEKDPEVKQIKDFTWYTLTNAQKMKSILISPVKEFL